MNSNAAMTILALTLSLFLWTYVRISAPSSSRPMSVPVRLEGAAPPGFDVQLHPDSENIRVRLAGHASVVDNLVRQDVKASVNIAQITADLPDDSKARTVKVQMAPTVETPPGVQVMDTARVTLMVTPLVQKPMTVTISFIKLPPAGTAVGSFIAEPDTVTVEAGSQQTLDQVEYVTVAVNPTTPLTTPRKLVPHPVDRNGELVKGVRVLTSAVEVRMTSLTGLQTTRRVAVRSPKLINPPRHYRVTVKAVRPDEVTLSGEAAALERQPAYLELEPLDVSAVRRDTTVTARLKQPKDLTIVEGTEVRVDLQAYPLD